MFLCWFVKLKTARVVRQYNGDTTRGLVRAVVVETLAGAEETQRLNVFFVFLPALFAILLLLARLSAESKFISRPTIWNSFDVSALPHNLTQRAAAIPALPVNGFVAGKWTLVFSPNTSKVATRIAAETAKTLNMTPFPIGNEHTCLFFTKDRKT